MFEIIFLSALALVWIFFATIQDLRMKEVANWLNFSLIIFALSFRFFYSFYSQNNMMFFYQGLIGLGIFFILGNIFYYARMFAGGDAKLLIALGAVLPFTENIFSNIKIYLAFLMIFLIVGAIYGMIISFILAFRNYKSFKKQFKIQFYKNRKISFLVMILGIILMALFSIELIFLFLGILIFILPYFYAYAKAVDEACMVRTISSKELREGDWLYKNIKIGKRTIKAKWDGLSKDEIKFIQKHKKQIKIKQGIAFVPVFLMSFIILLLLYFYGFHIF